jgi:hypothetical protein
MMRGKELRDGILRMLCDTLYWEDECPELIVDGQLRHGVQRVLRERANQLASVLVSESDTPFVEVIR